MFKIFQMLIVNFQFLFEDTLLDCLNELDNYQILLDNQLQIDSHFKYSCKNEWTTIKML